MAAHASSSTPDVTALSKRAHQPLVNIPGATNGVQFGASRLTADMHRPGRTISTNFSGDATKSATGVAATGVFTATSHGYSVGDLVVFVLTAGGSGLTAGLPYYVNTVPTASTFTVALTPGGTTVTFATDLTSGTSQRKRDGFLFDLTNMVYTTSSGRTALRAADGGTATYASLFTKEKGFRDWDMRIRYRPANDTASSSTDTGPNVYGNWTDPNNNWIVAQSHASGNPAYTYGTSVNGTLSSNSAAATASPLSTTQDRVLRVQKIGDLIRFKDWPTNGVEPSWKRECRYRYATGGASPNTNTDNPEYGSFGIYGQFMGAYFLEFSVTELVRHSENLFHNSDFRKLDFNVTGRVPREVSGVASTGLFTTTTTHSLSSGDLVVFGGFNQQTSGIGIVGGRDYYVVASGLTTTAFKVATSRGGTAITFSTDLTGGYVVANPAPAFWHRGGESLSSGNYLEVRHMAGPDGVVRPALVMEGPTAGDANFVWHQDIWNPLNMSGAGNFASRLQAHPQSIPSRRLEFSCWVKGAITAIQAGGFGITLDTYMDDAFANALLMTRQTYHPGLSPTTAREDSSTDPASYDGAQTVSTFDWTYLSSIIELEQFEGVNRLRCQMLAHEATDTGYVYVMDPCLRPVG